MKKKFGLLFAVMAMIASTTTTAQAETTVNLPDGAALTVDITSPSNDDIFEPGDTVTVQGTAAISQSAADKDTDVVFVLDTSGSTDRSAEIICDADRGNDLVIDDVRSDTRLTCEKAAVLDLIGEANDDASRLGNAGLAGFPTEVSQDLTPVSDGIGQFAQTLSDMSAGGSTNFEVGIDNAIALFSDSVSGATTKAIVILSDGAATDENDDGDPDIDKLVLAFTIAGAGCAGSSGNSNESLEDIVDRAKETEAGGNSACTEIEESLDEIAAAVAGTFNVFPAQVDDFVDITVNGVFVESVPLKDSTFSANVTLGVEAQEICAIATSSDVELATEDCVNITVEDPLPPGAVVVDCGEVEGTCEAEATDEGVANLDFSAPGEFDEPVTIVPTTENCPVASCRTGFDVLFPTTTADGPVVSITVTTENRVRFRDRLRAAVFIDGERITAQCSRGLLGRLRTRWGIPEPIPCMTIRYVSGWRLEYFVKFNADPGIRFR